MAEIANPFFPEILDGVAQALDKTDYQTFLGISHPGGTARTDG